MSAHLRPAAAPPRACASASSAAALDLFSLLRTHTLSTHICSFLHFADVSALRCTAAQAHMYTDAAWRYWRNHPFYVRDILGPGLSGPAGGRAGVPGSAGEPARGVTWCFLPFLSGEEEEDGFVSAFAPRDSHTSTRMHGRTHARTLTHSLTLMNGAEVTPCGLSLLSRSAYAMAKDVDVCPTLQRFTVEFFVFVANPRTFPSHPYALSLGHPHPHAHGHTGAYAHSHPHPRPGHDSSRNRADAIAALYDRLRPVWLDAGDDSEAASDSESAVSVDMGTGRFEEAITLLPTVHEDGSVSDATPLPDVTSPSTTRHAPASEGAASPSVTSPPVVTGRGAAGVLSAMEADNGGSVGVPKPALHVKPANGSRSDLIHLAHSNASRGSNESAASAHSVHSAHPGLPGGQPAGVKQPAGTSRASPRRPQTTHPEAAPEHVRPELLHAVGPAGGSTCESEETFYSPLPPRPRRRRSSGGRERRGSRDSLLLTGDPDDIDDAWPAITASALAPLQYCPIASRLGEQGGWEVRMDEHGTTGFCVAHEPWDGRPAEVEVQAPESSRGVYGRYQYRAIVYDRGTVTVYMPCRVQCRRSGYDRTEGSSVTSDSPGSVEYGMSNSRASIATEPGSLPDLTVTVAPAPAPPAGLPPLSIRQPLPHIRNAVSATSYVATPPVWYSNSPFLPSDGSTPGGYQLGTGIFSPSPSVTASTATTPAQTPITPGGTGTTSGGGGGGARRWRSQMIHQRRRRRSVSRESSAERGTDAMVSHTSMDDGGYAVSLYAARSTLWPPFNPSSGVAESSTPLMIGSTAMHPKNRHRPYLIGQLRITPTALEPHQFMDVHLRTDARARRRFVHTTSQMLSLLGV